MLNLLILFLVYSQHSYVTFFTPFFTLSFTSSFIPSLTPSLTPSFTPSKNQSITSYCQYNKMSDHYVRWECADPNNYTRDSHNYVSRSFIFFHVIGDLESYQEKFNIVDKNFLDNLDLDLKQYVHNVLSEFADMFYHPYCRYHLSRYNNIAWECNINKTFDKRSVYRFYHSIEKIDAYKKALNNTDSYINNHILDKLNTHEHYIEFDIKYMISETVDK